MVDGERLAARAAPPDDESTRRWLKLCPARELLDSGVGLRFDVDLDLGNRMVRTSAFAIRYRGQVHAYLNECQHVPAELDWQPGRFFDAAGLYLVCATHGAEYEPATGICVAGPCRGRRLHAIRTREHDGFVFWQADTRILPPSDSSP